MSDHDALRRMVREVLHEVLPRDAETPHEPAASGSDVRRVRVRDDRDLADLVTQVLNLADRPEGLTALRSGRIRFSLEEEDADTTHANGPIDVDHGAVTERIVQRAAREQRSVRLGRRAVLTPLARDRARALGVEISRRDPTDSSTQGRETR